LGSVFLTKDAVKGIKFLRLPLGGGKGNLGIFPVKSVFLGKQARVGKGDATMPRNQDTVEEFQPGWADDKGDGLKTAPPGNPLSVSEAKGKVPGINKVFHFISQLV